MANQHTPGPWEVRSLIGENLSVCDPSIGPGLYPLAQSIEGHTEREQLANARLIAAAPTMYEYIKRQADLGDLTAQSILATL